MPSTGPARAAEAEAPPTLKLVEQRRLVATLQEVARAASPSLAVAVVKWICDWYTNTVCVTHAVSQWVSNADRVEHGQHFAVLFCKPVAVAQ